MIILVCKRNARKEYGAEVESEREQGAVEVEDAPEVEPYVEEDELVYDTAQCDSGGEHLEVRSEQGRTLCYLA